MDPPKWGLTTTLEDVDKMIEKIGTILACCSLERMMRFKEKNSVREHRGVTVN